MKLSVRADCTSYALENDDQIDPKVLEYVKEIMSDVDTAGPRREEIVMHLLGYVHNTHVHGYDATDGNFLVEHKAETEQGVQKPGKLFGNITYGSVKTNEHLLKLVSDNPKMVISGWTRSGRLVYVIEFRFNESSYCSKIKEFMHTTTTPKATWRQIPSKYDVKFYNPKYSDRISNGFRDEILGNIARKNAA